MSSALLSAVLLLAVPQPAAADSLFSNGLFLSPGTSAAGPWTFNHASGFASNQGSPSGDGTDLAVHAFTNTGPGAGVSLESIIATEFEIDDPAGSFSFVDVTIAGGYILEVFGQGSAQVEAFMCQGFLNQCVVNFVKIPIVFGGILSNLSPTNEAKAVPYIWTGPLIANVPYTLKMHALASAFPDTQTRAFIDPTFTIADPDVPGANLILGSPAQLTNPGFIPPPVPEPSAALLVAARRR